jgi:ubiquinone/menaquinone biosynthesis C-methylase UbiE
MSDVSGHEQRAIARNVAIHDRVARKYDRLHGEIFNEIEQQRLRAALQDAIAAVRTGARPVHALDFGCGSGNLSRHLLDLGARVTAADVSRGFLQLVQARYPTPALTTLLMENGETKQIADCSFDLIATYSVLHHIPDYLSAVAELGRICKPGGIILIDHEASEGAWLPNPVYEEFRRAALRTDWRKYLTPVNYLHRIRRVFNPRYANEGDIHVWPDDHIEWSLITAELERQGFEIVTATDYLLNRRLYRPEVFARYRDRCSDTRLMVFRKCAA